MTTGSCRSTWWQRWKKRRAVSACDVGAGRSARLSRCRMTPSGATRLAVARVNSRMLWRWRSGSRMLMAEYNACHRGRPDFHQRGEAVASRETLAIQQVMLEMKLNLEEEMRRVRF